MKIWQFFPKHFRHNYYRAQKDILIFIIFICMREVAKIRSTKGWRPSSCCLTGRANVKTRVTHHRANKRGKTSSKSIRSREDGEERNAERTSRQLWMHYLSAERLLWLFRKSQQSSTASFAQWLFAIVPASFRRPLVPSVPGIVFAHRRVSTAFK